MKKLLSLLIGGLLTSFFVSCVLAADESAMDESNIQKNETFDVGRKMYMEGILPSGELMTALIQGDIEVTGEQVLCGSCHRRSGMGSTEGQQVVPAVTGNMLFNPLQLPTSQKQSAPILRPAYTKESLKVAIRSGLDANGEWLDPIMPRYPLDDESLNSLIEYMTGLSEDHSPGVDDTEIHFATVISEGVAEVEKKALLDVMYEYFKQKNVETRYETKRAEHAPWHKEWMFKPYRKWVLHVWELKGEQDTWDEQMQAHYDEKPVYALISGIVEGPWKPIHDYCENSQLPCLFPTTDLPVVADDSFYSLYMNRGMFLEAEGIAAHIKDEIESVEQLIQVYEVGNIKAETAANSLTIALQGSGIHVEDYPISKQNEHSHQWPSMSKQTVLVVWGEDAVMDYVDASMHDEQLPQRIYLSTTLFGEDTQQIPEHLVGLTFFIHPQEMPDRLPRLIARSTGWFKAKRIYSPSAQRIQANAYFALKAAGGALKLARGYFFRDYFIEKIENMTDNAPYTSVYPRISLAPDQRFVSKGYYIAKPANEDNGKIVAVTDWSIPP